MASPFATLLYVLSGVGVAFMTFSNSNHHPLLVETESGIVEGFGGHFSREGREYFQFLGIPYGQPPEGNLRFEPPEPVKKWEGILKADKFGAACMQFDAMIKAKIVGREDCLYLNVYFPKRDNFSTDLMPVMVYIHGGGFTAGNSIDFGPKYILDEDVVVVSMNYRLAALGFLNTGDSLIRGNMGLKDQTLALKWVQGNIQYFGGDSNQVTIFGESAGAASVGYHILSPLSSGLFHRAILQSGNALCPWALTKNPLRQAERFAAKLNCPVDNTTTLVDCLKNLDAKTLVKPHVDIMSPLHLQDDLFVASVEAIKSEDTFLSENPLQLLQTGRFNKVPVILGVNSAEGGLKVARLEAFPDILQNLGERWKEYAPILLHYDPKEENVGETIRNHYFAHDANISNDLVNLTRMISDRIFFQPTHWTAKLHSKWAPVYLYYYSYRSKLPSVYSAIGAVKSSDWLSSDFKLAGAVIRDFFRQHFQKSKDPKRFGACHGDDILLLWKMHWMAEIGTKGDDFPFSKAFVQSLTSFAQSTETLQFMNVTWPPISDSSDELIYMQLNRDPDVITEPFSSYITFWDAILNVQHSHAINNNLL